jgi:hypothetical protein
VDHPDHEQRYMEDNATTFTIAAVATAADAAATTAPTFTIAAVTTSTIAAATASTIAAAAVFLKLGNNTEPHAHYVVAQPACIVQDVTFDDLYRGDGYLDIVTIDTVEGCCALCEVLRC